MKRFLDGASGDAGQAFDAFGLGSAALDLSGAPAPAVHAAGAAAFVVAPSIDWDLGHQLAAPVHALDEAPPERAAKMVDLAASTKTSGVMSVGTPFSSTIDGALDVDWIKVTLAKGQTYTISAFDKDAGGGTADGINIVGLYDSKGKLISGTSLGVSDAAGETIDYTATAKGTYYIAVQGTGTTGTYSVSTVAADKIAPTLVSATPADNATAVDTAANLTLTFSESVHAGLGTLTLTGSDHSVRTIAMDDTSQVTFSGTTVTINPSADLAAGVTYDVTLSADAVRDYASNAYASTGGELFDFTTKGAPPVVESGGFTGVSGSGSTHVDASAGSWNVMIYIAGDNNLEAYGIADLNELESVLGLPSNVTITVLFDRSAGYSTASGNWSDTRVGVVTYDGNNVTNTTFAPGTSTWQSWGEMDTGAGATLTKFINWSSSTYAADNYGLIVWNHGGGIYGSAWDYASASDNLTTKELTSAIATSKVSKFDVISFDACLMQMAEVTHALAPYADYIVGSEDYVPANGAAYDDILKTFVNDSSVTGKELATAMVTTYVNEYKGASGIHLSAIDTSWVNELTKDMSAFVNRALGLSTSGADWTSLKNAAASAYEFGASGGYHYADLTDFMSRYLASASDSALKGLATEVLSDLSHMVVANGGTNAKGNGLAIYLPNGTDAVYSGYTASNFSWVQQTHWDQMLAYL